MPLSLSTEELDLLRALAAPIDHQQRAEFLAAVAAELEAASEQTGIGPSLGAVHRVARTVQRRFFDPPQMPNASKMARLKGEVPKLEHYGRRRDYRWSSVLAFSHRPALGPYPPPESSMSVAGMQLGASSVPATCVASVLTRAVAVTRIDFNAGEAIGVSVDSADEA
jgi:hypothetical protein